MITRELLRELFDYRDGILYWKVNRPNGIKIGSQAGRVSSTTGYLQTGITFNNKRGRYLNHRLIFLYHHGFLPAYIDHVDGDKTNNTIENLREASLLENARNARKRKDNSSGHKNVYWSKRHEKWYVQIRVDDGKDKIFGHYKDIDYAIFIAEAMRNKHHKEFSRTR